jgi:hypothetical protein
MAMKAKGIWSFPYDFYKLALESILLGGWEGAGVESGVIL